MLLKNERIARLFSDFIIQGLKSIEPYGSGDWTPDTAFGKILEWLRNDNFGLFVLVDCEYRPTAFACVEIHETGFGERIAVLWLGYSQVKRGMKALEDEMTQWARDKGAKAAVIVTKRSEPAYQRLLKSFGFFPNEIIYRKEL